MDIGRLLDEALAREERLLHVHPRYKYNCISNKQAIITRAIMASVLCEKLKRDSSSLGRDDATARTVAVLERVTGPFTLQYVNF